MGRRLSQKEMNMIKHHITHIPMTNMPTTDLLDGWEFERIDAPPFQGTEWIYCGG